MATDQRSERRRTVEAAQLDQIGGAMLVELQADAHVDPNALGHPTGAVVRIRPAAAQRLRAIPRVARQTREVVACDRITGEDCFLAEPRLGAIDDLAEIADPFVPSGRATTSIVHSSPVPRRPLPLDT